VETIIIKDLIVQIKQLPVAVAPALWELILIAKETVQQAELVYNLESAEPQHIMQAVEVAVGATVMKHPALLARAAPVVVATEEPPVRQAILDLMERQIQEEVVVVQEAIMPQAHIHQEMVVTAAPAS